MVRFREDSHRRVRQRKKELEKEDEERRKQSITKIKQQAFNAATNRARKRRELSVTPIAKRTRNAYGLTPIAKRFHNKIMENKGIVPVNTAKEHRGRVKMMKKTEQKVTIFLRLLLNDSDNNN
ncbi:hypothetical protein LOAG_06669 [Loa loa]|uniref:Uncharacterized protein n=1 Tax=Loa loa TaxID=7209 RepID=A0A1S0TX65_LOALO|nr:hypothetical protein LOAG_06669 [Loa loa]EFO21813.2 hypothetical protein LOAG_06669 [Loa loa]